MKTADKQIPVLCIRNFRRSQPQHPEFYIETMREHVQENSFISEPHRHDFYLVVFFSQGSGSHTIDFAKYDIAPGSLFFMSPAQMHTWQLSPDIDGYILFFNPAFYLLDFNQKKLFDFPFFGTPDNPPLLHLQGPFLEFVALTIRQLYEEFKGTDARKEEVIRSYLDILLIKLSGVYRVEQPAAFSPHVAQQIRQLETLIEQHFREHLSIPTYADRMNLSPKQLNAICKAALGKSVSELIQERVILEVKRLLRYTDLTVAQIAMELNYPDDSYFNRFFKKATGRTPESFRNHG